MWEAIPGSISEGPGREIERVESQHGSAHKRLTTGGGLGINSSRDLLSYHVGFPAERFHRAP